MTISSTTKMMAATIAAAIIAKAEQHTHASRDFLEPGDLVPDAKGDWIENGSSQWWSTYLPDEKLHESWKRMRLTVPYLQRVARHSLRVAMEINRAARAIENTFNASKSPK